MQTEFMLLAIYNKPRLSLDETCQALGMSTATGYTHQSLGKFPVAMSGIPLTADIRDVAAALDQLREGAIVTTSAQDDASSELIRDQIRGMQEAIEALQQNVALLLAKPEFVQTKDHSNEPERYLKLADVLALVGIKRSTVYRYIKDGKFPSPIQLGGRTVAWKESAIAEWQQSLPQGVRTG